MRLGLTNMANIDVAVRAMAKRLQIDLVRTPASTRRTLSLGVKYSPETACLPFKLQIGNMIEALEQGADTLVMPGGPGPCRFGYYHRVHEMLLRELGYKFRMITQDNGIMNIVDSVTEHAPKARVAAAFHFGITKLKTIEEIDRCVHRVLAAAHDKGAVIRLHRGAIEAVDEADSYRTLRRTKQEYIQELEDLPKVDSPPLKIGITGEFFLVIDPFANMDVETELGKLGVEVRRSTAVSDWLRLNPFIYIFGLLEKYKSYRAAVPYLSRHVGGDGWQSVGAKVLHAEDWDGIVHLEPFGCMPEIVARNILPAVKEGPPVLNLVYDEHTGKAGLISRLEAFVDMLKRQKKERQSPLSRASYGLSYERNNHNG